MTTLIQLLNKLDQALFDWYLTCNPDTVDVNRKDEAAERIIENGGTLQYVEELRMDIRLYLAEHKRSRNSAYKLSDETIEDLLTDIKNDQDDEDNLCWRFDEQQAEHIHKITSPRDVLEEARLRGLKIR